jgi:membrane associated rhomboid family serine protease
MAAMRDYLQNAPRWAWILIMGFSFGASMTVLGRLFISGSWAASVVGGVIGGALYGAFMGPFIYRQRRQLSVAAGGLSSGERRTAARAATRGPVPSDQQIRLAAARIAGKQLDSLARMRTFTLTTFGVAIVAYAFQAVTTTPLWWAAVAFFGAMFVMQLWWPRRLRRRIDLLTADADA